MTSTSQGGTATATARDLWPGLHHHARGHRGQPVREAGHPGSRKSPQARNGRDQKHRCCQLVQPWVRHELRGRTGQQADVLSIASVSSGNQSNLLSTAADLSEASLEDLVIQANGAVDDRGNKIALQVRSLHIPRQLEFEAARILKSINAERHGKRRNQRAAGMGTFPEGARSTTSSPTRMRSSSRPMWKTV
jgi:hypothetical protein